MVVAIHQPNYLPWCGYFAKMNACDVFILLDNALISKGSYTPRCQVRGSGGVQWLSIPVRCGHNDPINEVRFANSFWSQKHLRTLDQSYKKTTYFAEFMEFIGPIFNDPGELLAPFNERLIRAVAKYLGLACEILNASELSAPGISDDRLIALVQAVRGDVYLSGKGGTNYQDPAKFEAAKIGLDVRSYMPISYMQGGEPFVAGLSIVDCIFASGRGATAYLKYPSHELRAGATS